MSTGDDDILQSDYTTGEGRSLIAPLVGWKAEEINAFIILTLDNNGSGGFGASHNIKPTQIPGMLRIMANSIEKAVGNGG